jgi:hypothetical protein
LAIPSACDVIPGASKVSQPGIKSSRPDDYIVLGLGGFGVELSQDISGTKE